MIHEPSLTQCDLRWLEWLDQFLQLGHGTKRPIDIFEINIHRSNTDLGVNQYVLKDFLRELLLVPPFSFSFHTNINFVQGVLASSINAENTLKIQMYLKIYILQLLVCENNGQNWFSRAIAIICILEGCTFNSDDAT